MSIIRAAQAADLDFISFNDLNIFDKPKQFEGEHGNLLVFIDGEYSYLNSRLLNDFAKTHRHLQGVGRSQVLSLIFSAKKAVPKISGFLFWRIPSDRIFTGRANIRSAWMELS